MNNPRLDIKTDPTTLDVRLKNEELNINVSEQEEVVNINVAINTEQPEIKAGVNENSAALSAQATQPLALGVKDVLVNGSSVVENKVARVTISAGVATYDNTISHLHAGNVQDAIDEIVESGTGVIGVKGNEESIYRTGEVNLTPANIGAIPSAEKGVANGVASLDANKKVPASQLPDMQVVYDAELTIQKNGATVGTFTANSRTNVTADITVPTTTSELTNDSGYITSSYHDNTKANQSSVDAINSKIPSEATSSNQLADKAFVNSSIGTATATFKGTYNSISDIESIADADINDYAFYRHIDAVGNTLFDRYKYNGTTWLYEYTLNNSSFTADQWAAINSGVSANAWVDVTSAQNIDGQKDFDVVPRIKITHETHDLPSDYEELEYIESTGTQYINTGVILTNNYSVEIDYQLTNVSQPRTGIFGGYSTSRYGALIDTSNILEYGYGSTNTYYKTSTITLTRHVFKQEKNILYVDGNLIYTFAATTFTLNINCPVGTFAYTNYSPAKAKYYNVKVWNDTTLVRNYIPAKNKTTGKVGMYDIVNEQFYESAVADNFVAGPTIQPITYENVLTDANFAAVAFSGSYTDLTNKPTIPTVNNGTLTIKRNDTTVNTFTANSSANVTANIQVPTNSDYVDLTTAQVIDGQKDFEVVPRVKVAGEHPRENLPDIYAQLQYVESNGSQYIDTGFSVNTATDTVELTFELLDTTRYLWLFGEHDTNARMGLGTGDGTNMRNVAYGRSTYKVNDTLLFNTLHSYRADSTGVYIDETKIANYSDFSSTSTLALFCLNLNGLVSGTSGKVQSYKHTRNNTALIDLVPVKRKSDDKIGLYDFATNTFIVSGSGIDLIAGPEIVGDHYDSLLTSGSFANVAFTGKYSDLSDQPTNLNQFTNGPGYITASYHDSTKANQSSVDAINAKIPSEASDSNQLADKAFVNSSIGTATATFKGTYNSVAEIEAITNVDDNDYAFYRHIDSVGNTLFDRYKYNGTTWLYEYTLNNSSFTAAQWAAINSGVSDGAWVDKATAQVIDGQKDFEVVPRVKVTHEIHNLPSEYQEVEYIESSGTQYIDSNYIPNANTKIIFDSIMGVNGTSSDIRQGRHGDGQRLSIAVVSNKLEFAIGGYQSVNLNVTGQRHLFELDVPNHQGKLDGVVQTTYSSITWTNQQSLYFFARHIGSDTDGFGNTRNYNIKIYEQNQLIREYVPCYRIVDDVIGMYDIVNNVFYTNANTGTFIKGPDIVPITYESLLTDANFSSVAFSGNYTDLLNKPTIPTVYNATLNIQKNGTSIGTFTANSSTNATVNIIVPTDNDINSLIDTYMQSHYDNGDTEVY